MKLSKKLILGLLTCSISLTCFGTTFANNNDTLITSHTGTTVAFSIDPSIDMELAVEEMQALADANPNAGHITILEIGFANPKSNSLERDLELSPPISLSHWLIDYYEKPTTAYTHKNMLESDRFMESCAKGETKTIKWTISEELELNYSGMLSGKLELNNKLAYKLERGKILNGPPESSSYNTREFRVKFYENRGIWRQKVHLNDGRIFENSGDFTEPNRYVSYSVDRNA